MTSHRLFLSVAIAVSLTACGSTSSSGGGTGGAGAAGGQGGGGTIAGTGGAITGAGGAAATAGAGGSAGGAGATGGVLGTGGAGVAAACGDSTGPSSGDGCNTLTVGTVCVQETPGTGAVPTASGGTIMEGTYDLMSRKLYGTDAAVSLPSGRSTIMVSSVTATAFVLDTLDESGTQVTRAHGPVTISGSRATFVPTCPTSGGDQGGTVDFSATGATLTIIQTSTEGTTVSVYVKH